MGSYGRVWGHVAGSEVVVGGQAYSIDGDMWQGWDGMVGCGACGRVCGHLAGLVAGCWGMWLGSGYVVGGQAYGMDGDMWWGWGHLVGCGGIW